MTAIFLTYDIPDQNSFKNIRNWINQIKANEQTNIRKVLVGNKCEKHNILFRKEDKRENLHMILA